MNIFNKISSLFKKQEFHATGAFPSFDVRTPLFTSDTQAKPIPLKGGIKYNASDIQNQYAVGICTAISRTQLRTKQTGRRYSADFHYLVQKKLYDNNWNEGSSLLNSQKVANKVGFLPEELWTYTDEDDRKLPYAEYIKKLQDIPWSEIEALLGEVDEDGKYLKGKTIDHIPGYMAVIPGDIMKVGDAIVSSPQQTGLFVCVGTSDSWSFPTNPLKHKSYTGYHAIIFSSYEMESDKTRGTFTNTWGPRWGKDGSVDFYFHEYPILEAYIDVESIVKPAIKFTRTLRRGNKGDDVKLLQQLLGFTGPDIDGSFGPKTLEAVKLFQKRNKLVVDGIVGPKTQKLLESKDSRKTLVDALIQVESGGDDNAIGDKHLKDKAYGCLQIRKPCITDVNKLWGTNYKAEDMLGNRELSVKTFHAYMSLYATEKALGRAVTDEDRARIWNGGPSGWKNKSTLGYWEKAKKHLIG